MARQIISFLNSAVTAVSIWLIAFAVWQRILGNARGKSKSELRRVSTANAVLAAATVVVIAHYFGL